MWWEARETKFSSIKVSFQREPSPQKEPRNLPWDPQQQRDHSERAVRQWQCEEQERIFVCHEDGGYPMQVAPTYGEGSDQMRHHDKHLYLFHHLSNW